MSDRLSPQTANGAFCWVLYDGRAEFGDTDDAAVLEAFSSRRDLKANLWHWLGHEGVLFEYDDANGVLLNERRIGHLREGKKTLLKKCSSVKAPLTETERSAPDAV